MEVTEFYTPNLGEGLTEVDIFTWMVTEGDANEPPRLTGSSGENRLVLSRAVSSRKASREWEKRLA